MIVEQYSIGAQRQIGIVIDVRGLLTLGNIRGIESAAHTEPIRDVPGEVHAEPERSHFDAYSNSVTGMDRKHRSENQDRAETHRGASHVLSHGVEGGKPVRWG